MSQVVINDASILIDFHRLGLLKELASLPYQLWIPDSIWEDELLSLSEEEKQEVSRQFRLGELSGVQVLEAQRLLSVAPRLSLNDAFALVAYSTEADRCFHLMPIKIDIFGAHRGDLNFSLNSLLVGV